MAQQALAKRRRAVEAKSIRESAWARHICRRGVRPAFAELKLGEAPPFHIDQSHVSVVLFGGYAGCWVCGSVNGGNTGGGALARACRQWAGQTSLTLARKLVQGLLPHKTSKGGTARSGRAGKPTPGRRGSAAQGTHRRELMAWIN